MGALSWSVTTGFEGIEWVCKYDIGIMKAQSPLRCVLARDSMTVTRACLTIYPLTFE